MIKQFLIKIQAFFLGLGMVFTMVQLYALPVYAENEIKPKISIGNGFAVALKDDGSAWVWGKNDNGVFGTTEYAEDAVSPSPVAVAMPEHTSFFDISAGNDHVIALDTDGNVWTWGANGLGQLGVSTETVSTQCNEPIKVTAFSTARITAVYAGNHASFALDADGKIYAWGSDFNGYLGLSSADDSTDTPTQLTALSGVVVSSLYVGENTVAALATDKSVYLWGKNDKRQVGVSSGNAIQVPTLKDLGGAQAIDIALGAIHSSVLCLGDTQNVMKNFGVNEYGQFGNGKQSTSLVSATLTTNFTMENKITAIAAGSYHMLGLTAEGELYTWGSTDYEDPTNNYQHTPSVIVLPEDVKPVSIEAAYGHSALIDENGYIYVWGKVLGSQSSEIQNTPTRLNTASGAVFELGVPFTDIVQNVLISATATVPAPTYVVSIPATVATPDLHQKSSQDVNKISQTPITLSASGVNNLFGEKQVSVYLSTEENPFYLTDGTHQLPYSLYNLPTGGETLENGALFAVFTANGSVTGRIEIDQSLIRHTGVYRDTVTFEVRLETISPEEEEEQ